MKRCPTELRELAYFVLVRPKLGYGSSVWGVMDIILRGHNPPKELCRWTKSPPPISSENGRKENKHTASDIYIQILVSIYTIIVM